MSLDCQCPIAGWCDRHQRTKTRHLHSLCQNDERYRKLWDKLEGDAQKESTGGAGTELRKLLKSFGITERAGCKCRKRARLMDQNGTKWCRENIKTIIGWMEEEATARSFPFSYELGKRVVLSAIQTAERAGL